MPSTEYSVSGGGPKTKEVGRGYGRGLIEVFNNIAASVRLGIGGQLQKPEWQKIYSDRPCFASLYFTLLYFTFFHFYF